jgi:FKBP-type peptidyl-prolyl cis-trans isomerase
MGSNMRFAILAAFVAAMGMMTAAPAGAGDLSPKANAAFLAANAAKPGVRRQPSGLQYRVLKAGHGRTPKATDIVRVTYSGHLIDGTVFDQTQPGQIAEFPAGHLIAGWVEALSLMKEGDRWELVIPSNLAYGERGAGNGQIPPNQVLVFEMELIAVK